MGIKIPDELKADVPQTAWGKVLSATPVIMTVIATLLAGLASSEMTHAQYSRALAAQQQSKTGDQWAFFQAKRVRSAIQSSTLDVLQTSAELHPLDAATLASFTPPAAPGSTCAAWSTSNWRHPRRRRLGFIPAQGGQAPSRHGGATPAEL